MKIYIEAKPYDVLKVFYHGWEKLPPTPTASGARIKHASGTPFEYSLYRKEDGMKDFEIFKNPVSDEQAVALADGMRFFAIPAATY